MGRTQRTVPCALTLCTNIITLGGNPQDWERLVADVKEYLVIFEIYDTVKDIIEIVNDVDTWLEIGLYSAAASKISKIKGLINNKLPNIFPTIKKIAALLGVATAIVLMVTFAADKIIKNLPAGNWHMFNWRVTMRHWVIMGQESSSVLYYYTPLALFVP